MLNAAAAIARLADNGASSRACGRARLADVQLLCARQHVCNTARGAVDNLGPMIAAKGLVAGLVALLGGGTESSMKNAAVAIASFAGNGVACCIAVLLVGPYPAYNVRSCVRAWRRAAANVVVQKLPYTALR